MLLKLSILFSRALLQDQPQFAQSYAWQFKLSYIMTSICHLYHSFAFLASFDESHDHCRISQALLKRQCLSVKCALHKKLTTQPYYACLMVIPA